MRWRAAKIGAATVTGGVLLAVTGKTGDGRLFTCNLACVGGLAAPALAAGLAAVGVTGTLTTLASR